MKAYFLILNLLAPLPFALAQPSPAVIYPSGGSTRELQLQRAAQYERTAAAIKTVIDAKSGLLTTGDTIPVGPTYRKTLTTKMNKLIKRAKAARDSAR
jgi:hypothetical protein